MLNLRRKLLNSFCNVKFAEDDAFRELNVLKEYSENNEERNESWNSEDYEFYLFCKHILHRCLYILLNIKGNLYRYD